jgi:hypothetical protein
MATPQPVMPNTNTKYTLDAHGNLVPVRVGGPLRGSFSNFYGDRTELTGSLPYHNNWLNLDRPTIARANPWDRPKGEEQPAEKPRDWGPPDPQDISGMASAPRPYARPGQQFQGMLGQAPPRSDNLFNVNTREAGATPGTGMVAGNASPSQSYAGTWPSFGNSGRIGTQFDGVLTPQPSLGSGQRALGPGPSRFPGAIDTTSSD